MKNIRNHWRVPFLGLALGSTITLDTFAQPPANQQPVAAPADAAANQKFTTLPYGPEFKKPEDLKDPEKRKNDAIKSAYDEAAVKLYYGGYLIPAMSNATQRDLNVLRDTFLNDNFLCTTAGRESFSKYLLAELKPKIDQGNFHPAAVTNWIFVIGELDSTNERGRNRTPYVEASKALMSWVFDPKKPDYVRIASLAAIERHVAGWQAAPKAQFAEKLMVMLEEPKPASRSNAVHGFIGRRCLDLLAKCNGLNNPRVNQFVVAAIQDDAADVGLRLKSVRTLGAKDFAKAMSADDADAQMRKICTILLERIKYWNTQTDRLSSIASSIAGGGPPGGGRSGGMPGIGGPGMGGGGGGGESDESAGGGGGGSAPPGGSPYGPGGGGGTTRKPTGPTQPPEVRIVRRYIHEVLENVRLGMNGTRKDGDEEQRQGILPLLEQHDNGAYAQKILDELTNFQTALKSDTIKDLRGMKSELVVVIEDLQTALRDYPGVVDTTQEDEPAEETEGDTPPADGSTNPGGDAPAGDEAGDAAGNTTDESTGGTTEPGTPAAPNQPGQPGPGEPGGGGQGAGGNQ